MITLTDAAVKRLKEALPLVHENAAVRVAVKNVKCKPFLYTFGIIAPEDITEFDQSYHIKDLIVVISDISAQYLRDSEIDYLGNDKFQILNPQDPKRD